MRTSARCYTRASVFAIASTAELQSIATMEAMASGLPIVAANAVALPHLVHDGENGYLFEPGDVDALAARLTDVLTAAPEERLRMQQASLDGSPCTTSAARSTRSKRSTATNRSPSRPPCTS